MAETVRRALKLGKRDKIHYTILPDVAVVLTRTDHAEADDRLLEKFLSFLTHDVASRPERPASVGTGLAKHLQSLDGSVELDINAALSADDE